ncbi:unnamed protein product [Rotaria socialis]|uniref:PLAT domain-containing protein n=3 Tax=Rotaria socialis TaxID=392032 RepID=A0A817RZR0_9BILA|nr:unnamed protein product [Rotaria socialis]CAF3422802.1 unnamed protein product [Rotaria socialis]CAF4102845.1 unnamed protein product [Rotaria socialis]
MTHLDSSTLATYNSLADPHLQCYFSNERIRSHLQHAGLISRRGEIVPDGEYRLKLARRDHKKHVRQMLAENIVHRAIDMERARQAELRRQLDMVSKVALVHSIKESRRRGAYPIGNTQNSTDMGLLSMDSSWSQTRPKSASHHREIETMNEEFGEVRRVARVQSAHVNGDHHTKYSSKSLDRRHRQNFNQPKSSSMQRSLPLQRSRLLTKPSDSSPSNPPCRITMTYFGPHTKLDYDHSIFEPIDEIIVMQQHCGGENLIVYKDNLKPGDEFSFNSRRHSNYPFGLSLYVKGLIDSRISTCCEYKHRHGVKLGGERGHFAILSVEGSKPCIKCRFEKQTRLKRYGDSPKDATDDEKKKPITISIPVSDETKTRQTPAIIPVRQVPNSNENYAEDFVGSDDTETSKHDNSSESNDNKLKIGRTVVDTRLTTVPLKTPTETSSISTTTSHDKSLTKTWQIIFHTANIPSSSFQLPQNSSIGATLKFSFISIGGEDETEQYEIEMKDFPQHFKSGQHDSFRTKLRNIGTPQKIRLILEITGNDDDDNDDIKWQLDHIELIDPKTQSHYEFPCHQWIRPSQEKVFHLMKSESSQDEILRRTSKSTIDSKNASSSTASKKSSPKPTKTEPKKKTSRSSSSSLPSSYESPKRFEQFKNSVVNPKRQVATDSESTNEKNQKRYRISIYPSKSEDGEFNASNDSQIFIRLNNQKKNSLILNKNKKDCPSFEPGENKSFEVDLIQSSNEQPTKLTIGYYNSDIAAGKWKLDKIVLANIETGQETIFLCPDSLARNDFDLRAEQTFQAQSSQANYDNDDDQHSTPRSVTEAKRASLECESEESIQQKEVQLTTSKRNSSSSSESLQKGVKTKNNEKPLSTHSPTNLNDDSDEDEDDNEYNRMFKQKSSKNQAESDSSPSRPKTRRGLQNNSKKDNEQDNTNDTSEAKPEIWRSSSELDRKEPVDPLIGLDDLQDQTSRSNDPKTQSSLPSTNNTHTENQFKNWYHGDNDDDSSN